MKNKAFIAIAMTLFLGSLAFGALFFLGGCEQYTNPTIQRTMYVCNCTEKEKLQNFVQSSIKNANNMSDEEMEDVIHQLYKDGIAMYCNPRPIWVKKNSWAIDWNKQKIDSCETIMERY